jgi:hypothetical protein
LLAQIQEITKRGISLDAADPGSGKRDYPKKGGITAASPDPACVLLAVEGMNRIIKTQSDTILFRFAKNPTSGE